MRFAVMGAGGHSREAADLVVACGHEVAGFTDDTLAGVHHPTGLAISVDLASIEADAVTVAVGDPESRARLLERAQGRLMPALVHPSACVSPHVEIGEGVQVMQNVVVSAAATIGPNVILNVGCFVAHDCHVGAHTHVAPGVLMSGGSWVGERCTIGAGAILLPGVHVGTGCTVGAGAVVTADVASGETVVGVPARPLGDTR